jgi:RND superfamily putative drug exporter
MRPNLAERAARWSAAHWKRATFGWLAFVIVAVVVGQALGTIKLTDAEQATGESARAVRMLEASGYHRQASETVLVHSSRFSVGDAQFAHTLTRLRAALRRLPEVTDLRMPQAGSAGAFARDEHAALIQFDMRGSREAASEHVQPVLASVAAVQRGAPGFTIGEFGDASATRELNHTINRDFRMRRGCRCR